MPDNLFPEMDYGLLDHDIKMPSDEKWLDDKSKQQQSTEDNADQSQEEASAEEVSEYQDTLKKIHEKNKNDPQKPSDSRKEIIERVRKEYEESYMPLVAEALQYRVVMGMRDLWNLNIHGKKIALVMDEGEFKVMVDGVEYKTLPDKLPEALAAFDATVQEIIQAQPAIDESKRENATGEAVWRINPNAQEGGPYARSNAKVVTAGEGTCSWCGQFDELTEYVSELDKRYMLCSKCRPNDSSVTLTEEREASITSRLMALAEKLRTDNFHAEAIDVEAIYDPPYHWAG